MGTPTATKRTVEHIGNLNRLVTVETAHGLRLRFHFVGNSLRAVDRFEVTPRRTFAWVPVELAHVEVGGCYHALRIAAEGGAQ